MGFMGWTVLRQKMLKKEKREHRFQRKKRNSIQFNTAELLAASGPLAFVSLQLQNYQTDLS